MKFFVYTVAKAGRLRRSQARIQTHGNTAAQPESCPARNTAAQDKLGWTLSTEVRARRRGHSTQHRRQERGERREEISGR